MKWTQEEIKILKNNYQIESRKDLCQDLPNRTWGAIKIKSSELKLTTPKSIGTSKERFWRYVDKKCNNKCWNWTGCCNKGGYGIIGTNKKTELTHRFSWILHNENIPNGMCVLHICDNRRCVNPSHLFLGTKKDNSHDRDKKDRQSKGESNGRAKLTEDQVKQIRMLYIEENLTQREIGKIFNVDHTTVGSIYRNKTWRHIK